MALHQIGQVIYRSEARVRILIGQHHGCVGRVVDTSYRTRWYGVFEYFVVDCGFGYVLVRPHGLKPIEADKGGKDA